MRVSANSATSHFPLDLKVHSGSRPLFALTTRSCPRLSAEPHPDITAWMAERVRQSWASSNAHCFTNRLTVFRAFWPNWARAGLDNHLAHALSDPDALSPGQTPNQCQEIPLNAEEKIGTSLNRRFSGNVADVSLRPRVATDQKTHNSQIYQCPERIFKAAINSWKWKMDALLFSLICLMDTI